MTHGSLFSGIGGFDLAAEWMGWENVFHCEWNEFGKKVLNYYWPNSISYHDITKTDFTIHRGRIDILTGGFPCQPYSLAGKRLGKEDDRHLWPEMLRAIKEIQPRWVVGENVYGLVNWSGGLVFHEVQTDLETEGYEVFPYVLPACSVNAPHRRDRIWFVAKNTMHSGCVHGRNEQEGTEVREQRNTCTGNSDRVCVSEGNAPHPPSVGFCGDSSTEQLFVKALRTRYRMGTNAPHPDGKGRKEWQQHNGQQNAEEDSTGVDNRPKRYGTMRNAPHPDGTRRRKGNQKNERKSSEQFDGSSISRNAPHPGNEGLEGCKDGGGVGGSREESHQQFTGRICSNWHNFPTQSPICTRNDGLSSQLDGITFSKWRNESIKAAGNAIVPQVVFQIFKAIQEYENTQTPTIQAEV